MPENYKYTTTKKYPVIIILDRQNESIFNNVCTNIRYLELHGQMPQSVIIQLETDFPDRWSYSDHPAVRAGGKMPEFKKFIENELLEWAEKNYRTNANRTIIGHSAMGYFTNYVMATTPGLWSCIISMSSFFKIKTLSLIDSINASIFSVNPLHTTHYYLAHGDPRQDSKQNLLLDTLLQKTEVPFNIKIGIYNYPFANHTSVPGISIGEILTDHYGNWNKLKVELAQANYDNKGNIPADSFKYIFDKLYGCYNDSLFYELAQINGTTNTYRQNKQYTRALELLDFGISQYPKYYVFYETKAKIYEALADTKSAKESYYAAIQVLKDNQLIYADHKKISAALQSQLDKLHK